MIISWKKYVQYKQSTDEDKQAYVKIHYEFKGSRWKLTKYKT